MQANDASTITVRISPSIAADYEQRGVFPTLLSRLEVAAIEGAVNFRVSLALAREMLEDAMIQHQRSYTREDLGTKKSFNHLIHSLRDTFEPDAVAAEREEGAVRRREAIAEYEARKAAEHLAKSRRNGETSAHERRHQRPAAPAPRPHQHLRLIWSAA